MGQFGLTTEYTEFTESKNRRLFSVASVRSVVFTTALVEVTHYLAFSRTR